MSGRLIWWIFSVVPKVQSVSASVCGRGVSSSRVSVVEDR